MATDAANSNSADLTSIHLVLEDDGRWGLMLVDLGTGVTQALRFAELRLAVQWLHAKYGR